MTNNPLDLHCALSIVIRTLNEARWLPELIAGIETQSYPGAVEIILVDSGSDDETVEIARQYSCKIVTIDRAEFTFGRSLNRGCDAASGDILVFVSGHCIPANNDWLVDLVDPLVRGATYSYGRQIGGQITRFSEQRIFEKYFPEDPAKAQGGFFCNNANAALVASAWRTFKFDEELTGLEDMDLARRLAETGHQIAYAPTATVLHLHDETWRQVSRRYEREGIALRKIVPEITMNGRDAVRYVISAIALDLFDAARKQVLLRNIGPIALFRLMQYYGAYRGNRMDRKLSRKAMERYFYPGHRGG